MNDINVTTGTKFPYWVDVHISSALQIVTKRTPRIPLLATFLQRAPTVSISRAQSYYGAVTHNRCNW